MTAKDILYQIKDKHNIGTAWQLTEHIIIEAMESYAKEACEKVVDSITDKDIEKFAFDSFTKIEGTSVTYSATFGAKWMKDQIKSKIKL